MYDFLFVVNRDHRSKNMNVHLGYKYGDMSKVSTGDVTYRVTETRDMSPVTIVNEALRCVIITSRQLLTP